MSYTTPVRKYLKANISSHNFQLEKPTSVEVSQVVVVSELNTSDTRTPSSVGEMVLLVESHLILGIIQGTPDDTVGE